MTAKKKPKPPIPSSAFLSTGSTLLNLACSGRVNGGFFKGGYEFIVGDSASGKTWQIMTAFAEASINPNFDGYEFVFDNAENGALMDVRKYFGAGVAERMVPPAGTKEAPENSSTLNELFFHLDAAMDRGPCIYAVDSIDPLFTEETEDNFEAGKKKHFTGKGQVKGSMGMEKPKFISQNLGRIVPRLAKTGSILIVISQTRDKVGFGAMPGQKTRGGGHALRFYAHHEIWCKPIGKRRKKVNGKWRTVGSTVKMTLTEKNRVNGWLGDVTVPIYRSAGIDDLGGCVEYLIFENHWKKPKGKKEVEDDKGQPPEAVIAPEFDYEGPIDGLVKKIEDEGREDDLRQIVAACWREVEEKIKVERKSRYG
jgi:RecA/RadA recombinase